MRANTKKKHEMGRRFAILIGVAAAGVTALGASGPNVAASTINNNNGSSAVSNISSEQTRTRRPPATAFPPKIATTVLKTKHDTANNSIGNVK